MGKLKVELSEIMLKKLKGFKEGTSGTLLKIRTGEDSITVLGLIASSDVAEDGQSLDLDSAELHCPGGVECSGSFIVTSEEIGLQDYMVIRVDPSTDDLSVSYCDEDDVVQNVNWVTVTEAQIAEKFFVARSRVVLPVSCELSEDAVQSMIDELREKVHCPAVLEINDAPLDKPLETPNKRKQYASLKDMEIFDFTLHLKVNGTAEEEQSPNKALLIDYTKRTAKCCWFDLTLDTLTLVPRRAPVSSILENVEISLCQNLSLHEKCLVSQLKNSENFSVPETFHFLLEDAGHFLSIVYPKSKLDRDLTDIRTRLHTAYALPMDRPVLMRGNAFSFTTEEPSQELICPHEGLGPSGVVGGEPVLVQGRYKYYHYCQQGAEDAGWGCAYRSLQTLCSWFKLQGYTNRPVPTIKQIQQCLVDIGDKPSNFVGSSQWIGSTEVGFCLDTLLGVSSRISTVPTGDEMSMKGGELSHHFRTQGTPVMIGGGNLAHTILGVDYNKKTGDIKFLILDPHYTGADDLNAIIANGWCRWKPVTFWQKKCFYNMCMPIRPKCI